MELTNSEKIDIVFIAAFAILLIIIVFNFPQFVNVVMEWHLNGWFRP